MDAPTEVFVRPLDAVFESMSGFTGTGLTMAAAEQQLPQSIHWWRSLTEWAGGVGVIVLTMIPPGTPSYINRSTQCIR